MTSMAGFNQYYNFSIVNSQNTGFGFDCSKQDEEFVDFGNYVGVDLDCQLLDITIQYFSNGTGP